MPADARRVLCISLHDVAPATLSDCIDALAFLDDLNLGPVALLVVPDYHGLGRADRDDRFAAFIESRILHGDEIVLHGYSHQAAAPRPRSFREWLTHRFLADNEGEFSRLDFAAARTRILRGLVVLRSAGWHPIGFMPPTCRMSAQVLSALEESPLQYCSMRDNITVLRTGRVIPAPRLHIRAGAGLRRAASLAWRSTLFEAHAASTVVRASLHPAELRIAEVEALWRLLPTHLNDRTIVTEAQLIPSQFTRTTNSPDSQRIPA